MKLLSLKGRNFGLLKGDFEFEFDESLTVITGPIGCGKSTILTMVRASLTNSFPGNAASWASWGVSPQEACYFIATWRIGNKTLHIAKAVAGEKKFATLNIPRLRIEHEDGTVEDVFGSREALEKTHALIPVPASIIDGHLIVDQDSITTPVASTPAKFKEIIHVLTRTNELENIRSKIRDMLLAVTVPDVEVPLQEARAEKNVAEGQVNLLSDKISALSQAYEAADINSINAELDAIEHLKASQEKSHQLNNKLTTARSSLQQLQTQKANSENSIATLTATVAENSQQAEEARKNLYSADMLIAANNKQKELMQKAAELAEELQKCIGSEPVVPDQEEPAEDAADDIRSRIDEVRNEYMYSKRRRDLALQGACPECGVSTTLCEHDMELLQKDVQELSARLDCLSEELRSVTTLQTSWRTYHSAKKDFDNCVNNTVAKASEVSKQLDELENTPHMTEDIKRQMSAFVRDYDVKVADVARIERNLSAVDAHIEAQMKLVSEIESEISQLPKSAYDSNVHAKVLKRHQDAVKINDEIKKLSGSMEQAESNLSRAVKRLETQEKRAKSVEPITKFRSVLEKASSALMKDGLPRLLSLQYMRRLNDRLKFYLEMINADFTAYIDDNLEFMAQKADGLVHHARRLSGGQKQQASVCYLLAVNDVFASTLGVLALDEPSGAMQEHNSKDLAEAFNYLAKMGQATGRQFIVITHSPTLAALGCKNICLEGVN